MATANLGVGTAFWPRNGGTVVPSLGVGPTNPTYGRHYVVGEAHYGSSPPWADSTAVKSRRSYLLVVLLTVIALCGVVQKYCSDLAAARRSFRSEAGQDAQIVAREVSRTFRKIYEGMRTIARLPSVRRIDRRAEQLDADARTSIQEIYNNLANSVAMSEIYIVPVGFDPDRVDPGTQKSECPILTFDELIVGHNGGEKSEAHEEHEEEVEIYEYRLMTEQLADRKRATLGKMPSRGWPSRRSVGEKSSRATTRALIRRTPKIACARGWSTPCPSTGRMARCAAWSPRYS